MCDHCGCTGEDSGFTLLNPQKGSHHHIHEGHSVIHDHIHPHSIDHTHDAPGKISVETDILHRNDRLAQRNRGYFEAKNILALNLVSSPGSGKTSLLERTVKMMTTKPVYVIEGDQQTSLDADRIHATGVPVVQINTGSGCHLDAGMIHKSLKELNPSGSSLLLIENVGNLVCPALFDLGENFRVVILSVTEGEDKPLKYPNMFQSAHICLINKMDLLPYVDFKLEKFKAYSRQINPNLIFIETSAKTGEGLERWVEWMEEVGG